MDTDFDSQRDDGKRLRRAFVVALAFTAVLWLIKLVEILVGLNLARYGVYPLRPGGLEGIFLGPLIHGSVSHVFANTAPLLVLGTALLYGYPRSAKIVLPVVYLGSGLGVWLFGRAAYHIGASGLTFGVMFFVFTIGVLRWEKRAIVLSMVVFFLYGSMIWGIFPHDPAVSFESHLSGAVLGVVMAVLLRNHDPLPPQKKYSWEYEAEDAEMEQDEVGNG